MTGFGWDFPPGVTGLEPQITGEYPCENCGRTLPEECSYCEGSGEVDGRDASNGRSCPYCEDGSPTSCPGGCAEPDVDRLREEEYDRLHDVEDRYDF